MRALRVLSAIIFLLAAVYFVVPLFLEDDVAVTEEIVMDTRPVNVFRQVYKPKQWLKWSEIIEDQNLVNSFSGPEQGIGARRSWKGEEAGNGSLTVTESQPYEYILSEVSMDGGESLIYDSWNFELTDNGTLVNWTILLSDLPYPHRRWMGLFAEMELKPKMQKSLSRLKKLAEALPEPPEIKIVELPEQPVLVIPDSATVSAIPEMLEQNLEKLFAYVEAANFDVTGQHFALYHNWNPEGMNRVSVGVPVEKDTPGWKTIKYFEIPETLAVFAQHTTGGNTGSTHNAIDDYIRDFDLETRSFMWETYLYNPAIDKDSTQWVTWIYYPIK